MKKRIGSFMLALLLAFGMMIPASAEFKVDPREGIALISVWFEFKDGGSQGISRGTGFFVGEEGKNPTHLITNYHVIQYYYELGSGELLSAKLEDGSVIQGRCQIRVYYDEDDYEEAYIVEADSGKDVAVLELNSATDKRVPLALRSPSDEMVGDEVYAVGYPGLADNNYADSTTKWGQSDASVTKGIISRLSVTSGTGRKNVQIDCDIKPGNSGGPLVDIEGRVLGINTWDVSDTAGDQINYAVNIDEAITILNRQDIPYTMADDSEAPSMLLILGGIAVAVIGIVIFVLTRKKSDKKEPAQKEVHKEAQRQQSAGVVLEGIAGPSVGQLYPIGDGQKITIGRVPGRSDIALPACQHLSSVHCEIAVIGTNVIVKDLNSTNGTYIGETRLYAGQGMMAENGAHIYLGNKACGFRVRIN